MPSYVQRWSRIHTDNIHIWVLCITASIAFCVLVQSAISTHFWNECFLVIEIGRVLSLGKWGMMREHKIFTSSVEAWVQRQSWLEKPPVPISSTASSAPSLYPWRPWEEQGLPPPAEWGWGIIAEGYFCWHRDPKYLGTFVVNLGNLYLIFLRSNHHFVYLGSKSIQWYLLFDGSATHSHQSRQLARAFPTASLLPMWTGTTWDPRQPHQVSPLICSHK